jgi:uncharacterized protein YecE (DUF72 family)
MNAKRNNIHIGTSGWHYKHWLGPFYPPHMPPSEFLDFYDKIFDTLEINNSFYNTPKRETFENWRKMTPKNFIFSVKASRYITHNKKLLDGKETFSYFIEKAEGLGNKLGPVLFQLPPSWKINRERLEDFLKSLPKGYQYTFEFRNPTWFDPGIYGLLNKYNAAFTLYELNAVQTPKKITADFIYIRLHGPGKAYQGQYNESILKSWAEDFKRWKNQVKAIYCYFDNDEKGYATMDAKRLIEMVEK